MLPPNGPARDRASPEPVDIEQVFARFKTLLRKAAPRSVEAGRRIIGALLDTVPPDECTNDLRNSGDASGRPPRSPGTNGPRRSKRP